VVIRRGEMVSVDCLSGRVVLRATARALSAGVEGQIIEFKVPGADRTFTARVAGPGRAVAMANATSSASESAVDTARSQEDRP
jgi:flagella basal body P-ring formation protein FlgA